MNFIQFVTNRPPEDVEALTAEVDACIAAVNRTLARFTIPSD
jgi:hypothetical protein